MSDGAPPSAAPRGGQLRFHLGGARAARIVQEIVEHLKQKGLPKMAMNGFKKKTSAKKVEKRAFIFSTVIAIL